MTNLLQASKQALDALEVSTDWDVGATGKQAQSMKAITALRQAIAQAEETNSCQNSTELVENGQRKPHRYAGSFGG